MKGLLLLLALSTLAAEAFNRDDWQKHRQEVRVEAAKMSQSYRHFAERVLDPAENVTIPIDTYPDGNVKNSITAKKAYMFLQDNIVWGEDVRVSEFDRKGREVSSFTAKNIIANRKRRTGWVPNKGEISYSETGVAGNGIYIDFGERFVSLSAGARVVSRRIPIADALATIKRDDGVKSRKTKDIVASITSDRADYDHLGGIIYFEGNVQAKNSDYTLNADRVYVFLADTNQLRRVVAEGSVAMTNLNRSATCAYAVFQRDESKLVMFGDENEPARLVEDGQRNGDIEGSKIVLWTDSEQIEISDSRITVDTSALRGKELLQVFKTENK